MLRTTFAAILLLTAAVVAASDDQLFVAQLRRLQLFDLAERYCERQLQEEMNAERQVNLTIEWIRTLALRAANQASEDRAATWLAAHTLATDFQRRHPDHPQLVLVEVQDALTLLAQGDWELRDAQAPNAASSALADAAERLRAASKALEKLSTGLEKRIVAQRQKPTKTGELSVDELQRLKVHIAVQLAKSRRLQAVCYPADSRDRKALLLATRETLEQGVATLSADDELAGQMRVLQMACLRELGELDAAARVWSLVEKSDLSSDVRRDALAETARLYVAARQPEKALALLEESRFTALLASGDADVELARLEALLAGAQVSGEANDAAQQKKYQRAAAALAQYIEQRYGAAWGRRADQLVSNLLSTDTDSSDLDLLVRVADNLFVKQQFAGALAAYDKAAAAAQRAGDVNRNFELRYKGALLEQQQKQFAAAAARFERVAIEFKSNRQAADAHLLACWNKAQQARTEPAAATTYEQLLQEHLERFPSSATSQQARVWLGAWLQAQKRWSEALSAYAGLTDRAPDLAKLLNNAATCARNMLQELRTEKKPLDSMLDEALRFFEQAAQWKGVSPDVRVQAATLGAELAIDFAPSGISRAEKLLAASQPDVAKATATLQTRWQLLQAITLAVADPQQARYEQVITSLASNPDHLLLLLDRLAIVAEQGSALQRKQLAGRQSIVIDMLRKSSAQQTFAQQQQLTRRYAESLVALGQREAAVAEYARLAKSLPNSGAIQEAYAELLSQSADPKLRIEALGKWRQIASKSAPRSERWWKAKYQIALLQKESGDTQAAATLCRYLLETPPGIDDRTRRAQFEALLKSNGPPK